MTSTSVPKAAFISGIVTARRRLKRSNNGWKREANGSHLVTEKLPFFALAVTASVVTYLVQQRGHSVTAVEDLPLGARSGNALISCCRYLGKLFYPRDLAVFYPHPGHWPLAWVLLAGGLILGLTMLAAMGRRRYPFLLAGWLWFLVTLAPVIGLVQVGGHSMADRYTYLPLIGMLVLVVWGAHALAKDRQHTWVTLFVALLIAIFLCMALTRQQLRHWTDSEALFRHALEVTKNNYIAHNNLGSALDEQGQTDEAIRHYQEAIRLKPDNATAHNNLGIALVKKDQVGEAIRHYQEAIRLKPDLAEAHYSLANALLRTGQTDEAIRQYQEAARLKPDYADAHNNLGSALVGKGRLDEAIEQFREVLRLKLNHPGVHINLGIALGRKGQTEEAIRCFQEALRLQPDSAEAHCNLGIALARKGQTDEAIRQFQEALKLEPEYADARRQLNAVLALKQSAPLTSP